MSPFKSPRSRSLPFLSTIPFPTSSSSPASSGTPSSSSSAMDSLTDSEAPRRPSTFSIEEFSDLCSTALDLGSIPEPHLSFLPNLPFSQENLNSIRQDSPASSTFSSGIHSFEDTDAELDDDVDLGEFTCAANSSEDILGAKHRERQRERMQQRQRSVTQETVTASSHAAGPYSACERAHDAAHIPSGKGGFFKNLKTRASALVLSKVSSSNSQQATTGLGSAGADCPQTTAKPLPPQPSPRSPGRPPPSSFPRFLERSGPKSFLDINDEGEDTALPRPSLSSSIFRRAVPAPGRPSTPIPSGVNVCTGITPTATPGLESTTASTHFSFSTAHPYFSTPSPRRSAHPTALRGLFASRSTSNFPKPSRPLESADYAAPLERLDSGSSIVSTYTAPRPAPPKPTGVGYIDLYGRRPSAPEDYAYARAKEREAMKALPPLPVRPRVSSQTSFIHPLALASYKSKTRSRSKIVNVFPAPLQIQIPRPKTKRSKSSNPPSTRNLNASSSTSSSSTTPIAIIDVKRQASSSPFFHLASRVNDAVPPLPPLPPVAKVIETEKKRNRTRSASVTSQISDVLSAGLAGLGVGIRARSKSKDSVEEEDEKEEALEMGRVFTPEDDPFKKADVVEVRGKKGSTWSTTTASESVSEEEGKWVVPPRMRGLGLNMSVVMGHQPHPYASAQPVPVSPMYPPPTYPLPEVPHVQGLPTPPNSSIMPPSSAFEDGKAFVYPALGPLPPPPIDAIAPTTMLPTPPMTTGSGRRQSFIDMDGGRKVRHVPTLEEVRDHSRTRSGSPFPLPFGSFGEEREEEGCSGIEEGQSRIVFTNPWVTGGEGRGSLDTSTDSAVDVEWPLPPRRVVTVVVDGEEEGKEGGWHEVEQGAEFFPRKSTPDPSSTAAQMDIGCRHLIMFPKKGSLVSEDSTATSLTDGSAPGEALALSGGGVVRRGSERIVVVTDGDTRGWSSRGCPGDDKSTPTSPTSPTTRQLSGQQARAIVERFGGKAAEVQSRRSEDSSYHGSAYHSARSSVTPSLPPSPEKRNHKREKVVIVEEVSLLGEEGVKGLFGRRGERLKVVAPGGWKELMSFFEAFEGVRMGERAGQKVAVSLMEEREGMAMVLEVSSSSSLSPSQPTWPASPKMPGHWYNRMSSCQEEPGVVSAFHLPVPTTLGEIARSCRRGFVGEGVCE